MARGRARRSRVKRLHTYWIYFVPSQNKITNWYCRGHGHTAILTLDLDFKMHWLLFDPQPSYLKVEVLPYRAKYKALPKKLIKPNKALYCVKIEIDLNCVKPKLYRWWHSFLPKCVSCVSLVEYILGIKTKAFTPYGLLKYLKKLKNKRDKGAIHSITFIKGDK